MKIRKRLFNAKDEGCECLKFFGISGRRTDLRKCFLHQCSRWLWKPHSRRSRPPGTIERHDGACRKSAIAVVLKGAIL